MEAGCPRAALPCAALVCLALVVSGGYLLYTTEWRDTDTPGSLPYWLEIPTCYNSTASGSASGDWSVSPMSPFNSTSAVCPSTVSTADVPFLLALDPSREDAVVQNAAYSLVVMLPAGQYALIAFSVHDAQGKEIAPPSNLEIGPGSPDGFPWRGGKPPAPSASTTASAPGMFAAEIGRRLQTAVEGAGRSLRGFRSFHTSSHSYSSRPSSYSSYSNRYTPSRPSSGYHRPATTTAGGYTKGGTGGYAKGSPVAKGTPVGTPVAGGTRWGSGATRVRGLRTTV